MVVDASMLDRIEAIRDLPHDVVIAIADRETEMALGRRAHVSMIGLSDPAARFGVSQAPASSPVRDTPLRIDGGT